MKNLRVNKIKSIHKTALSILGMNFEYDNVMYYLDHLPMIQPSTVGSVYESLPGSTGSKSYTDAIALLETNLNTAIDIESGTASSFTTLNHVQIIVASYVLIIENPTIFDCTSALLNGSDGLSYSLNDLMAKFNMTSNVGFMFKDHYKSFCSDPSRWIIHVEGHDRFFLPGSVKIGTFVDKHSVVPVSGSTTSKKIPTCKGDYISCKEDFMGYFYETEGNHYTGPLPYTYDHHHGISVGDSSAVFEKWFEYSQTCGVDCCYPNFVKWYKQYKKIIGRFDPAKAVEVLQQEIDVCNFGKATPTKAPKTPSSGFQFPELKFPRVTLPEVEMPTFGGGEVTPAPESPLKDIESISDPVEKEEDCDWTLEEVRYLLQSLLTGNKPMLSAGSKETGGTYTEARHKEKILFFDVYKKLTGKNIRKMTEKYIEKLPVGGKGIGKFLSNVFSKPSRELISKVADEVYSALLNYAKSPSTKRYQKYCDDNKEVQEMYNRAKVFMALQDLATGSFSASTETITDSARSRRDIVQQRELPMEETSDYMRRNSSIKSNMRKKALLKIYNSSK